jgi:hypothetical protein
MLVYQRLYDYRVMVNKTCLKNEKPTGILPVDFLYSYPLVMEGGDIPSTMVSIKHRAIGTGRKEI